MGRQGALRGRGQFSRVLRNGRRVPGMLVRASYLVIEGEGQDVRCGISVPRETGKAVRRNRVRRLIREALRLHVEHVESVAAHARIGVDIVLQFRPPAPPSLRRLSLQQIMPDVEKIFRVIAGGIRKAKQ